MSVPSAADARATSVSIPAWGILTTTVALVAVVHAVVALRSPSPWIVPDELIYSELAKSLGEGGLPRIREELSFSYGLAYPALLAPAWAVFENPATAYAVAKVLNALILGLTAVPAYFLARRFVSHGYSVLVAALSVAVPSLLYAGTLMTEVALYPAFVLALFAIAVALERPGRATQAAALGAIALASAVKIVAIVLVPAYVAAIVLHHWLERSDAPGSRTRLSAYAPTWIALSALTAAGIAVAAAAQRSPFDLLGAYVVVLENVDLTAVPWWALLHLAELDLYVAVIPFAVTLVIVWRCLRGVADGPERLFVALALPCSLAVLAVVSGFASTPSPGGAEYPENVTRIHERSTFILVPLFMVGLALWLRGRPGLPRAVLASVACAALLPAVLPLEDLGNVSFQALALEPWAGVRDAVAWPAGVLVFTLALGLLFVSAVRVRAPDAVVVAPVFFVLLMVALSAQQSIQSASEFTRSVGVGPRPDWIDVTAGDQGPVAVLWSEPPGVRFVQPAIRHRVVWLGEFFNRSVGEVYELGSAMPYGLPSTSVRLVQGRVVLEDGRPAPISGLVLVPCHVHVAGTPIARDPATGATVVRVSRPVQATVAPPASCSADRP